MTDKRPPGVEPPGQHRAPLPPINFEALARALLDQADSLLQQWLPDGVQRGHEYVCGSLQGGRGTSTSVNMTNGKWADFATGEQGGDLLSLYAVANGLTMGKAALQVARELGLEDVAGVQRMTGASSTKQSAPKIPVNETTVAKPVKPASDEGWATVVPVPENAIAPTFRHGYRKPEDIEHNAEYRIDGALYGYVVRFRTSDGGKDTLPYTWCASAKDGGAKWCWKTWDEPRPLYFPAGLTPGGKTVILVEGEKKAGTLQALLEASTPGVYCVASWPGGCKAWKKADWHWLQGSPVLLWPDCDAKRVALSKAERESVAAQVNAQLDQIGGQITTSDRERGIEVALTLVKDQKPILPAEKQPGMAAMLGIGALLREAQGCTVSLLPVPEPGTVVDGWDCGDAIATDGWDAARVLAFLAQAQPLPAGDAPAVEVAGKKIAGLVDTGDGGLDDSGFTLIGSRLIPDWLAPYYDKVNKRWLASRKMVILILERDPALCEVLAYNDLSNNVQSRTPWPWPHSKAGDVTDAVDLLLGKYLTDTYGLPSISRAALSEAIQTVAHTRRFHPVREYLQALQWDQVSRIDKWLIHALGESPDSLSPAMLEYLQIVGRCLLLGMVNRVMVPGCKFDYCPVFEGVGGLRKSTLVEILASSDFFSDTPFEVGRGKEAQEQVAGLWVYEIAELSHFSKAEVGAIKGFISSKVDRYRVAYGATISTFPRQVILIGTTNENTYLRDRTGNRRFWPIPVRHTIKTEWVAKYRDQLLAEAFALFGQGVAYTPTPNQEKRLFAPMQESRLVETAVISELLNVLTRAPVATGIGARVNELTSFVTIAELTLALGVDAAKSTPALEAQIRGWLDHEGWSRVKKQINGARAWGYTRPVNWPPIEADEDMTAAPEGGAPDQSTEQDDDDAPF